MGMGGAASAMERPRSREGPVVSLGDSLSWDVAPADGRCLATSEEPGLTGGMGLGELVLGVLIERLFDRPSSRSTLVGSWEGEGNYLPPGATADRGVFSQKPNKLKNSNEGQLK